MSETQQEPQEEEFSLDEQVFWCIRSIEKQLQAKNVHNKEVKSLLESLKVLANEKTPLVKKRQVMRMTCGDYRGLMQQEIKNSKNKIISEANAAANMGSDQETANTGSDSVDYDISSQERKRKRTPSKYYDKAVFYTQDTSNDGSDSSESDTTLKKKKRKKTLSKYYNSTDDETLEQLLQKAMRSKEFSIPQLPSYAAPRNIISGKHRKSTSFSPSSSSKATSDRRRISNSASPEKYILDESGSSIKIVKVAGTPNNDCSPVVVMLERILKELEKLNGAVNRLTEKQAEMTKEIRRLKADSMQGLVVGNYELPSDIELPVETDEQLIYLNHRLQTDGDFQISLVKYLHARAYGKTATSFLMSVSKQIMTRDVAVMYSRLGRKGKKSFEELKDLFNTIMAATALRHNDLDKEQMAEKFGKMLAQAGDWDGSRVKLSKLFIHSLNPIENV